MTMSVAENPTPESTPLNPQHQLAIGSAVGAVALLAGLWFIFGGLPMLWSLGWDSLWADNRALQENVFLSDALLILIELLVVGGLTFAAYRALQSQTQPGLRAGIVFLAVYFFLVAWIGAWLGSLMDQQFEENPPLGWTVLAAIMGAFLAGAGYLYLMVPGWMGFLETVEHQGWFHGHAFKGNQGVRVRRGTIVGVLAVGVCGIITLTWHAYFGRERPDPDVPGRFLPNDWFWSIPYTHQDYFIPLMFKVHLVMPLVLGVLLFWVAWRVVNIPAFADFLIATEAEMNKVSWTNRKRLGQDTVVVLTTVFLFTAFLFVVDVIWIKVLSAPGIQVLLIDPKQAQKQQEETAKW
jgi:preprotein translocase SecE subunit